MLKKSCILLSFSLILIFCLSSCSDSDRTTNPTQTETINSDWNDYQINAPPDFRSGIENLWQFYMRIRLTREQRQLIRQYEDEYRDCLRAAQESRRPRWRGGVSDEVKACVCDYVNKIYKILNEDQKILFKRWVSRIPDFDCELTDEAIEQPPPIE